MARTSVDKALEILLLFDEERKSCGIHEMAKLLSLSPGTVHRLATVLKRKGFLRQDPETKKYMLGTVFLKLANLVVESLEIAKIAYPYMQKLARETGETVHLNIIDGYERICIESIESSQPLMARMPVGSRSPLYAGASSKCLLAFSPEPFVREYLERTRLEPISVNTIVDRERLLEELERVRVQGYAESFSERVDGLGALSAPILGFGGELLASMSLAVPEIRFKDEALRRSFIEALCRRAREISSLMGYGG